jgi:hypothetical protein
MLAPRRSPEARALFMPAVLAVSWLLAACSDDEVPVVTVFHPTLVEVSPEEFLGSVPCLDSPRAMRRYVATVFDSGALSDDEASGGADSVGDPETDFALPSSTVTRADGRATPTPCTQDVGFSRVIQGNRYWAEIEGYDRDDLVALAPGTRVLYDPLTSERVPPRWTTRCSQQKPVTAYGGLVRVLGLCEPLEDASPGGETLVEVSIDAALGGLECGDTPGAVERFELTPPGAAPLEAACGELITFPATADNGSTLTFALRAFEAAASEPTWGTSCGAQVVSGVTTRATCLPLVSEGVLEVDPEDALGALGLECAAASFEELTLEVTDGDPDTRHVDPGLCTLPVQFLGRVAGSTSVRASARLPGGVTSGTALCTGTVIPGDTVRAACAPEP